jgi:hypothetical protein
MTDPGSWVGLTRRNVTNRGLDGDGRLKRELIA